MPLYTRAGLARWTSGTVWNGVATTSQTFTVGRVIGTQFVITDPCQIDALAYTVGTTSAGNVIGGVVGPVSLTADSALAGVVVAQSASTAQGTQSTVQVLTWTAVSVLPGIYYAFLEGSDATGTYLRIPASTPQATGGANFYDRAGGFGAFTNPTPAVTEASTAIPGLHVRVASF